MSADFQICISVPLIIREKKKLFYNIPGAIHSNNISEILTLFEIFEICIRVTVALEISLLMKSLWLYCIYRFFLGACLSKISVQIVENAYSLFSFRNCTLNSCVNESKKVSL